ncbi:unnamed protein product [Caretta caretta]
MRALEHLPTSTSRKRMETQAFGAREQTTPSLVIGGLFWDSPGLTGRVSEVEENIRHGDAGCVLIAEQKPYPIASIDLPLAIRELARQSTRQPVLAEEPEAGSDCSVWRGRLSFQMTETLLKTGMTLNSQQHQEGS